jgi:hypothetical protein
MKKPHQKAETASIVVRPPFPDVFECAIIYRAGVNSTWADLEGLGRLHYT